MSRENVELMYAAYARFNNGERRAVLALLSPDFVLRDRTLPEYTHDVEGVEAYAEYLDHLFEAFGELRYEVESVQDLGNRLAAKVRVIATGARTGAGVAGTMGHVWTWRDGKVTRSDIYGTWDEALEAVGLRE